MSNRFYFGDDNESSTSLDGYDHDNDPSSLPFPKPLDRSAFLVPDFDPATFLSSLSNRFQTLEDLQEELRELSQSLSKELVDLVNDNYQDFLSLGSTLSGGEEKVEEIRVGLLGFQRDVTGVRDKVQARKLEVQELLLQKKALRREVSRGRNLLEIAERLDLLHDKLKITNRAQQNEIAMPVNAEEEAVIGSDNSWSDDWNDEPDDSSDEDYDVHEEEVRSFNKLQDLVEQYRIVCVLMQKHDQQHPFLVSQKKRLLKVYNALQVDLETAASATTDGAYKEKMTALRSSLDE